MIKGRGSKIGDRGSKIEDRIIASKAILDLRSSILLPLSPLFDPLSCILYPLSSILDPQPYVKRAGNRRSRGSSLPPFASLQLPGGGCDAEAVGRPHGAE